MKNITATELYELESKDFPVLPDIIKNEDLENFVIKMLNESISTQRNFFMYIFLNCEHKVYKSFLDMWDEVFPEILDEICPYV